jgi:hypothetical protein
MTITLETIGETKCWVATITGTDKKFGWKREFVEGARDYSGANSVRTRGVHTSYDLTEGVLYEINQPCSWRRTERYLAIVRNGKLERVDAAGAKRHLAGAVRVEVDEEGGDQ